ncbi:MAG TPA: helix-turn-helix transcriptional regulator [Actinophytocola sp.]|uniref:helix-turn-helix transcriptional regulator n=1 Tax=Actinophytocola sp. TaxID=1872138 RepID=UPI002DDCEA58|nr:helix-turn-helix transcriptional regulator [Actinophytocola sp.]HEV2783113.1 helix-turn-helix transcriptional regulator [Actinophytocola sp.]
MDRAGLADFLRSRRDRLQPTDVGLAAGRHRRTPGLRREEVAQLAAMSVDYYTRLEQARGPQPSRAVLTGIARALRLSDDERAYLFHLAGQQPEPPAGPPQDVPPSVLHLLDRLDDTPALVLDAKFQVLAWNQLAAALITDFSAEPPRERNLLRRRFLAPPGSACRRYDDEETIRFGQEVAADLRAALARYPDDPGIRELLDELLAGSPEFAQMWAAHEVRVQRTMCKTVNHPVVGPIDLQSQMLLIPDRDQRVVLYTAVPGTSSHEALQLLKVIGTQDLTSAERYAH